MLHGQFQGSWSSTDAEAGGDCNLPEPAYLVPHQARQCALQDQLALCEYGGDARSALQRLGIEPKMNAATVGLIFGKFLYLFLASLLMGLLLGLFSALLLKNFNVSQTPQVTDSWCSQLS